jgi:hypothetical protein
LAVERLSFLRPERLALHEVFIRVMADLSVPDGEKYEDLGVNFRKMTAAIMDKYIAPKMPEITRTFEQLKREASDFIGKAQTVALGLDENFKVPRNSSTRRWLRLFLLGRKRTSNKTTTDTPIDRDLVKIAFWRMKAQSSESPLERHVIKHWYNRRCNRCEAWPPANDHN